MNKSMLTKKTWHIHFWSAALLLVVVCALQTWTDLDFQFQKLWYNGETQKWWLTAEEFQATRWLWYGGAKKAVSIFGGICVFVFLLSYKVKKLQIWRKCCFLLMLSLLFVPLVVGSGKKLTNIYCPNQTVEFNGSYEQHRIFEILEGERAAEKRGACFPAGHCSGGFALLMLFFALPYPRLRFLGLFFGFLAGSLMGGYQIVRGEHFLSDTLATVCVSWMICLLIVYFTEKYQAKLKLNPEPALLTF